MVIATQDACQKASAALELARTFYVVLPYGQLETGGQFSFVRAVFHPYYRTDPDDDLLGYPHGWVGSRYAQPIRHLQSIANEAGISLTISSKGNLSDADVFFFWERPRPGDKVLDFALRSDQPRYLIATEPEPIVPLNYDPRNVLIFDKIFTWRTDLIDSRRWIGIRPITFKFASPVSEPSFHQRRFCVMIASINRTAADPNELYSQRADTAIWFDRFHPMKLDFYGRKNRYTDTNFGVYRGPVAEKIEVMKNYKFCICYENSRSSPGYISEKIFDALFAGCVPIYWGDDGSHETLPNELYIDRRSFGSHEELYECLESIGQAEYDRYRVVADRFLRSPFAQSYNERSLASVIMNECFGRFSSPVNIR